MNYLCSVLLSQSDQSSFSRGVNLEMRDSGVPVSGRLEDEAKAVPSSKEVAGIWEHVPSSAREFDLVICRIICHGVEHLRLAVDHCVCLLGVAVCCDSWKPSEGQLVWLGGIPYSLGEVGEERPHQDARVCL